jgi:hypothetical protein
MHASPSSHVFVTCLTSGSCADCERFSPNSLISLASAFAQDTNLSIRGICHVSSYCLHFRNNSASDPSSKISNSTDYKRGYTMGELLAKNCHDHSVINGSRLFVNGFLDGYDTMNITKCQDIGFR